MRGVVVPAGDHRILWSYRSPGLRLGLIISLMSLIAFLGAIAYFLRRSRAHTRLRLIRFHR